MKHRVKRAVATLLLPLFVVSCGGKQSSEGSEKLSTPNGKNVILFVIDGPRHTEAFDDPTHQYIPRMWNDLRPLGAIIPGFRNDGLTLTNPGHASILTGTWQHIANNGSERPTRPTVFEYYRRAYGVAKKDTYVVAGKQKEYALSYSTHPEFGRDFGATEQASNISDRVVYNNLISVLQTDKPRLVLACFASVDRAGHSGNWSDYLSSLSTVDSLLFETWNFLQSDPFYAGKTYLIMSNDHGRHDDDHGGFENHGDDCEGCRKIMFLALGPGIKKNYTTGNVYTQRDICDTVGKILEFPALYSEASVIEEIFSE